MDARHLPGEAKWLVERSLSEDDLEISVSVIVRRLGYKATWKAIARTMRTHDAVTAMRRDPASSIFLADNAVTSYPHHVRTALRAAGWNNTILSDSYNRPSGTVRNRHFEAIRVKANRVIGNNLTIRDYNTAYDMQNGCLADFGSWRCTSWCPRVAVSLELGDCDATTPHKCKL